MDLGYNSTFFFTMFSNIEQFIWWKCLATLQSSSVMTEVLHIERWNCPLLGKCDSFPMRLVQSGQQVPAKSPGQKSLVANLYLLAESL